MRPAIAAPGSCTPSGVAAPLAQRGPVLGVPVVVGGPQAVAGPPLGQELGGQQRVRLQVPEDGSRELEAGRQHVGSFRHQRIAARREGPLLRRTIRSRSHNRSTSPTRIGGPRLHALEVGVELHRARRPRCWPAASTPPRAVRPGGRRRAPAGGHRVPRPCFRSSSPRRPPSSRRRDRSARSDCATAASGGPRDARPADSGRHRRWWPPRHSPSGSGPPEPDSR